jgi:hypothetical protein
MNIRNLVSNIFEFLRIFALVCLAAFVVVVVSLSTMHIGVGGIYGVTDKSIINYQFLSRDGTVY